MSDSKPFQQLSDDLDRIAQNTSLLDDSHFIERVRAIEFLELESIEDDDDLFPVEQTEEGVVRRRAQQLQQQLTRANDQLFAAFVAGIRAGDRQTLKIALAQYEAEIAQPNDSFHVRYDELDTFLWGILDVDLVPEEPKPLEPDMVYYQPSSTKIILRLIKELPVAPDDIFYDLGSGLGHVPVLVNLLTGIRARGVEIQPFYCRYSDECLRKLNLPEIAFTNADARDMDYDDGTIFYMFTPFRGKILRYVLDKLAAQASHRPIRVCTYGPCTPDVLKEDWLELTFQVGRREGGLAIFRSR